MKQKSKKRLWFIVPNEFDITMLEQEFALEVVDDSGAQFDAFTKQAQEYLLGRMVRCGDREERASTFLTVAMLNSSPELMREMMTSKDWVLSVPS
jgi:hypothetical protein